MEDNYNLSPLWELRGIYKQFPGVQALEDVSMSIKQSRIHALVGENGSGKSTLVKCLAGVHQPEQGQLLYKGEEVELSHPIIARQFGVATIYQEFSLVPTLTVAENIFLGRQLLKSKMGGIDWEEMHRQTSSIMEELSITIDPSMIVRNLSVAQQQLIEIVKAISANSTLLIMDEPTAALGIKETEQLFKLMKRLAEQGKAILYISHRLDEVFQIADYITVLKDGHRVGDQPINSLTAQDVIKMMVGYDIANHYPKEENSTEITSLEVRNLSTDSGVRNVSFDIRKGEVFGFGGMVGSKRTEIALGIFGADRMTSGEIFLDGQELKISSPIEAIKAGIGLVPENRKADGLLFNFAAPQNITLSRLEGIKNGLFLDLSKEQQVGQKYVNRLNITSSSLEKSVQYLSGGNQQKVVIARWLYSKAKLLILDEPTQGIDVGAKVEVYQVINELTSYGISVLLISSDYPELIAISDRIALIRDGQILQISPAKELNEYKLLFITSRAH
ncbi:MAG: sugar ABC transporter ATP-binding protein [Brevefilum sp.]|nr:sugar ABC transporter ATP-binding protein [Brevefilum sp.]